MQSSQCSEVSSSPLSTILRPFSYIGFPPTEFHCNIIVFSCGYFIFDILWCPYMKIEELIMLLHHLFSLYGFVQFLFSIFTAVRSLPFSALVNLHDHTKMHFLKFLGKETDKNVFSPQFLAYNLCQYAAHT